MITAKEIQELRKRNPFVSETFKGQYQGARLYGWEQCCDELEKMREEKE